MNGLEDYADNHGHSVDLDLANRRMWAQLNHEAWLELTSAD